MFGDIRSKKQINFFLDLWLEILELQMRIF